MSRITTDGCSEWSCPHHGEINRRKTELRDRIFEAAYHVAVADLSYDCDDPDWDRLNDAEYLLDVALNDLRELIRETGAPAQ